jgi:hypothetical protein
MMVIEDVDVVEPEPLQALVEACDEVFPRAEVAVWARPHVPTCLRGDDEFVAAILEVVVEDPGEVGLGAAVWRSVVVGQIEMGYPEIEGPAQDGALDVEGPVVTEILPQPQRHRWQEEAAAPTTAVCHGLIAILSGKIAGHVALLRLGLVVNLFEGPRSSTRAQERVE